MRKILDERAKHHVEMPSQHSKMQSTNEEGNQGDKVDEMIKNVKMRFAKGKK